MMAKINDNKRMKGLVLGLILSSIILVCITAKTVCEKVSSDGCIFFQKIEMKY